jgi:hypothetical protein
MPSDHSMELSGSSESLWICIEMDGDWVVAWLDCGHIGGVFPVVA